MLDDMPLVIDIRVPLSLRESLRHPTTERLLLIDQEKVEEVKDEGIRALKRRRSQEAFASALVDVSSEGT